MTPEEKAKELIEKFETCIGLRVIAIPAAIICVEEILNLARVIDEQRHLPPSVYPPNQYQQYWHQVLNNLKQG